MDKENVYDPPYLLLQALIETSFELVKLLALRSSGTEIAQRYLGFPDDPLQALSRLELGMENYALSAGPAGGQLVQLKRCPFGAVFSRIEPWSEEAQRMVERFNQSPRGGAALHPICVAHLSVREAYGATNLGCRSASSGVVAVSLPALLQEAGMVEEDVRRMLDGSACLYWLR